MDDQKRENEARSMQSYAALGVGFVCVVIGLPLWWKTTEVYRVQLPYSAIDQLSAIQVGYRVDLTVVLFDSTLSKIELAKFGEALKGELRSDPFLEPLFSEETPRVVGVTYRGNIRKAYEEEVQAYRTASDLQEFDELLHKAKLLKEHGKYTIMVVPKVSKLAPVNVHVGKRRSAFMTLNKDLNELLGGISSLMRDIYVGEEQVEKAYISATGSQHTQTDKESMRSVRTTPGYEVTFTLLNPQPDILSVSWNIATAVKKYVAPLTEQFEEFAEFIVKSQVLHYSSLSVRPQPSSNGSYFTEKDLPHLINPMEAQLNSHVSTHPNLNFIVYIPSRDQSPLYIHDHSGSPSATNAFLSPQWGGILIYNVETPKGKKLPAGVNIEMKPTMEVFLAQLRLLLGIPNIDCRAGFSCTSPGSHIITLWELDSWLRVKTLENIAQSSTTLGSLAALLEQISNIVINDDIGMEVEQAVTSISRAHTYLAKGQLREAFLSSKDALVASEKAFFDKSLLELLYFPEDQKFAIYIPLFLPISIPVLMSVLQAFKWIKATRRKNKTTKKD